ncbi:disulfide bond formation protein B [Acetobacter sp. TBRC 12305]|uniref:Disulfide bond formation protein B n=1 Tax=Acetobacter garciniae TaxID=2817435 RepID=A0A939HML0_9PROT|nr:disulfide bond formation protein B [Acetobacter garciniae]MBO1324891.1 disulfide bond formation protein B [Acetobacter garciniae]MBX0344582.1 disulfide bond formation protein B [Acetobacter garciniae]
MRQLAVFMVLAACAALGVAWWTEHELGIMPCELCLWERWPWRGVLAVGAVAAFLPVRWGRRALWLCAPLLVAGIGLSICHGGVEWGWWPSPLPACHAPHISGQTLAERLASMPLLPSKPCDAPTYLIPGLPVSMTVMGGVYALFVLVMLILSLYRQQKEKRRIFH